MNYSLALLPVRAQQQIERRAYMRAKPEEQAPELLTVPEACAELRIKRSKLYMYLHSRQLTSVKLGSRRLIPRSAIRALVEDRTIEALPKQSHNQI
ncbi:helix-turn-helix domain-containing protein [Amycolatopsis sp. lyj-346]|uniref:helix-turn-helix domain-containing protein n=1 Tax=Amycolatopsis sp. lyj-346 TaxID=2789289 RepID=UPI00397D3D7A